MDDPRIIGLLAVFIVAVVFVLVRGGRRSLPPLMKQAAALEAYLGGIDQLEGQSTLDQDLRDDSLRQIGAKVLDLLPEYVSTLNVGRVSVSRKKGNTTWTTTNVRMYITQLKASAGMR